MHVWTNLQSYQFVRFWERSRFLYKLLIKVNLKERGGGKNETIPILAGEYKIVPVTFLRFVILWPSNDCQTLG